MFNCSMYGLPQNFRFCDIWDEVSDFLSDYKSSGIYLSDTENRVDDEHMKLLYYLLYSRHGNDSIASRDPNRFKYGVFALIFQYGPSWVKKLKLQSDIREMDLEELSAGGKAIYNHAFNPGTAPNTGYLEDLPAINEQNTTNFKKSKAEALQIQYQLINTDVTEQFLSRFRKLFVKVAVPDYRLWYKEEDED